ncbi:MAG: hypothetical protein LBT50_03470 [Prevotellaceae bacterium]|jgi:hypothetical protein|nr:hypothetical protein [Prevotellaceae bacterium]
MKAGKIIQRAAFSMFRDWTKEVSKKYPTMDLTISDETELVNDTKKTIHDALNSLASPEYIEERKCQGWSIGFVIGFIRGTLSTYWFYQYIQQQTDTYRYFIAVKSILEYMRIDTNLSWKLDALYKPLLISDINLNRIELKRQINNWSHTLLIVCP